MKYTEQTTITVSEDTATNPSSIRFQDTSLDTDLSSLTMIEEQIRSLASNSTNVISMGSITTAKFLWIKPQVDVQLLINGSVTPITVRGGKASKLWTAITSLTVVVPVQSPVAPVPVTLVLAG